MSRYEQGNLETARRCDRFVRGIEWTDPDVLRSVVNGSSLRSMIHNPVTESIDEG